MLSSGNSGHFSMGLLTKKELKKAPVETDNFLSSFFGAVMDKTLIINASAMGVKVFSHFAISDTGPRTDLVIDLLKTVAPCYDKTFVVGDPLFIKQLAEESIEANVNWPELRCWFISGGDWMPETLRAYVHLLTNRNLLEPEKGFWFAIYGLTELGYPIFFETEELVGLRAKTNVDKGTVYPTVDHPRRTTPFLFHYFPSRFCVETIENSDFEQELVFSTLDNDRLIKLKRYASGDCGELLNNGDGYGLKCPLPLVRFWGRLNNYLKVDGETVHVTDIKELLFENHAVASMLTGFFSLFRSNGEIGLDIQLKYGFDPMDQKLKELLNRVDQLFHGRVSVCFKPFYQMHKFLVNDMERKFNPLNV
jgi:phenylacetate-coenzyme A ligase PaaK-like adenylate-forming protein